MFHKILRLDLYFFFTFYVFYVYTVFFLFLRSQRRPELYDP